MGLILLGNHPQGEAAGNTAFPATTPRPARRDVHCRGGLRGSTPTRFLRQTREDAVATINPPPRRPIEDGCNGPAPTYAHGVEAFLIAHDRAGAWSAGTAVKYRQSLTILGSRLAEGPTGASVAALDIPACQGPLESAQGRS